MINFKLSVIALAVGVGLSVGVMAETLSKKQYKSIEKNLGAKYELAKTKCKTLKGNAKDICITQIKGNNNIAKAKLDDTYNPTAKTWYKERVAKAEANYAVAIQLCNSKSGNNEEVCVKEAKAAKIQEESYAKAQLKSSKADAVAIEKMSDARKDAEIDTRDANYAVAKQKCEVLDGAAEDLCISNAKTQFGLQ